MIEMKRLCSGIALTVLAGLVHAQQTEPQGRAKLTASNVLLAEARIDNGGRFHSCQPLTGQVVEILEVKHGVDGILGLDLAKVRVLGGHCDGSEGWVGLQRLAVVQ